MSSAVLENLKSQLRALGGFHERQYHHSGGDETNISIPVGAITQVTGPGKTESVVKFVSKLMKDQPKLRLAWVENEISIYPCALVQRNLNLQNILFTEARNDYVWATLQILASGLFDVVVLSLPFQQPKTLRDLKVLRRLQLASEKSKVSLIFLLDEPLNAWPISLHLEAQPSGSWSAV
jgi:hypothetical protein